MSFGIYAILLRSFAGDAYWLVGVSVIRNFLMSIALMTLKSSKRQRTNLLMHEDYIAWIWSTIGAAIVTTILMFRLPLNSGVILAMLLLYIGLQGVLISYTLSLMSRPRRSVLTKKNEEKNNDEDEIDFSDLIT